MANLELLETWPASYKEIPFLFIGGSIAGGRKDVVHKYPNSDRQSIEDLGKLQRGYRVQAVITGDDYFNKRDALLRALENKGAGDFEHPFEGVIKNIVCRTFTLTENFAKFGEANFDIVFAISTDNAAPEREVVNIKDIEFANDKLRKTLVDNFSVKFKSNYQFINSFKATLAKMKGMIASLKDNTKFLNDIADKANQLSSEISTITNSITSLINAPLALAESIDNIFLTANAATQSFEKSFEAMQELFGFGSDDSDSYEFGNFDAENDNVLNIDNASTKEYRQNIEVTNATMQSMSLGWAYVSAVNSEFKTEDEVANIQEILDAQYDLVANVPDIKNHNNNSNFIDTASTTANNFSDQKKSPLDSDALNALANLRVLSVSYLEEVKKNAARTIEITTPQIPMRVLLYNYYGDSTNFEEINTINRDPNVSFIEGDLQVISDIT